ncbi:thiamine-phosphate kinase [Leptospira ellisii]|uniref:Thiamine-monophosphate kinase n=1 Tax=Leptospira ellisii TaxID=2023197 RepID=A0AAE4QMG4_9LEPT|nr:thiamine-phosphate kinase [Leptospira ellisii]MDV6235719.1 thiamine-phosphate kinase [Leptospira ellisii]
MKENSNLKESEIIRTLYSPENVQTDDCYFDAQEGRIYTTDTICEGTHFRIDWSGPSEIARKLVEVNVSDIAAAGGVPTKAFFNFGLSPFCSRKEWLLPFAASLRDRLSSYGISLCGGDTYRSSSLNLTLTLVGTATFPWKRSGGNKGEFLYLSGSVGLSRLGYKILKQSVVIPESESVRSAALERHLSPTARLGLASELRKKFRISACMDLTDGLLQDLPKLAASSGVGLRIDLGTIPLPKNVSPFLRLEEALGSGEELELLFLSPDLLPNTLDEIPITKIGEAVDPDAGVVFLDAEIERNFSDLGFEHF